MKKWGVGRQFFSLRIHAFLSLHFFYLQVGTSACGATAVINVLLALDLPYSLDLVLSAVPTRLRAQTAPLPQYLASRGVAGTTHKDLIGALHKLTKGDVYSR